MTGRARIRTRSPEGSTVIVIITHNRVLHAVNNNFIMIKTMFVTPGAGVVKISEHEALPYLVNCILSYLLTPTRMCGNIVVLQQGFVYKISITTF